MCGVINLLVTHTPHVRFLGCKTMRIPTAIIFAQRRATGRIRTFCIPAGGPLMATMQPWRRLGSQPAVGMFYILSSLMTTAQANGHRRPPGHFICSIALYCLLFLFKINFIINQKARVWVCGYCHLFAMCPWWGIVAQRESRKETSKHKL